MRRSVLLPSLGSLCLASALAFAPGCSGSNQDEDGEIVLEFWTIALGDAFADYINGMIADYEAQNPGIRVPSRSSSS